MPIQDESVPRPGDFPNVILLRMRRRTGRLGLLIVLLSALLAGLVGAACACWSILN